MKESFDSLPIEKKKEKIKDMDGERLVSAFLFYHRYFDPIDSEFCNTYDLLKGEIIGRCKR